MNIQNSKFELTAVKASQYPQTNLPEIAFVGRSNVGKSSLINTLLQRKSLARIGAAPGKTRTINFFNIDQKLYFVDLPGYGYAKVSKAEKSTWSKMIEEYLHTRTQLKLMFLLVDVRHAPSPDDQLMIDWMIETKRPFAVVATKVDKLSRAKALEHLRMIQNTLNLPESTSIFAFSSENRSGKEDIWLTIREKLSSL